MNDRVLRKGDGKDDSLEIQLHPDGDIFIFVRSTDYKGNISEAKVEFCLPNGGGYHPKTRKAIYNLMEAMKKDNEDPKSPERYKM